VDDEESMDKFFKMLKKNKHQTKRIVLADVEETAPTLYAQITMMPGIAELFRDVKVLNIKTPGKLDENQQTEWQMDLFMTAILARFLETGDKYFDDIRILLTDMLEGCFSPGIGVKKFVEMLAAKEDENTSIRKVKRRIEYFLFDTPAISLIEKLPVEWEAIKEFYQHL